MSQQNLVFMDDEYLGRSWGMLTRQAGWVKPVLLLTMVSLVPILGGLVVCGYALEWARLTAWGVDSSPKQSGISFGTCLSAGWRGLLVSLCWGIPYALVAGILRGVAGEVLGGIVGTAISLLSLLVGVIVTVAMLRATIYQRVGAGVGYVRVLEMVEADFGGIVRIVGISLLGGVVSVVACSLVFLVGSLGASFSIVGALEAVDVTSVSGPQAMGAMLGAVLSAMGPAIALAVLVGSFISTLFILVTTNAVGLWVLQFDVPAWGDSSAPLPQRIPAAPRTWDAPSVPVVPAEPLMPDQTILPEDQSSSQGTGSQDPRGW